MTATLSSVKMSPGLHNTFDFAKIRDGVLSTIEGGKNYQRQKFKLSDSKKITTVRRTG